MPNNETKLANAITQSQVIMTLSSKEEYSEQRINLIKIIAENYNKICCVTINKSYNTAIKEFDKVGIDKNKFVFIDASPGDGKKSALKGKCIFISTPSDITAINIEFSNLLDKTKFEQSLFDSIDTLQVYTNTMNIIKLVHALINKIRTTESKIVFLTTEKDSELTKELYMFVDKVIDLTAS